MHFHHRPFCGEQEFNGEEAIMLRSNESHSTADGFLALIQMQEKNANTSIGICSKVDINQSYDKSSLSKKTQEMNCLMSLADSGSEWVSCWQEETSSDESNAPSLDEFTETSEEEDDCTHLKLKLHEEIKEDERLFEPLFDLKELDHMDWRTSCARPVPRTVKAEPKGRIAKAKTPVRKKRERVRKDHDAPMGQRIYFTLTEKDVGMGRGGEMNRHPGNLKFHEAKRTLQPLYKRTPKEGRTGLAQQLVDQVHAWGGRFLKKDDNGFYQVHNHTARTKCSQALREDYTAEERAAKRERFRRLRRGKKQ